MPRDANGRYADIAMGPDGTIARTNYARLYLMHLGASAEQTLDEVMEITGLKKGCSPEEVEYLDESIFQEAWDFMMMMHRCVNPRVADILNSKSEKKKRLHLYEVLDYSFNYVRDVGCDKPLPHAVLDIENIRPIVNGPVTHQLIEDGLDMTTVSNITIAPLPIMLIDKTAEDTLTVATAAHGAFGILVKHNKADKYTKAWKDTPPRILGESENRAFAAHTMDPEMVVDMNDRANSPEVQLEMGRRIVSSETPGGIDDIVDRRKFDYGNSRSLAIPINFLECYGLRVKYVPEDMNPQERIVRKR